MNAAIAIGQDPTAHLGMFFYADRPILTGSFILYRMTLLGTTVEDNQ